MIKTWNAFFTLVNRSLSISFTPTFCGSSAHSLIHSFVRSFDALRLCFVQVNWTRIRCSSILVNERICRCRFRFRWNMFIQLMMLFYDIWFWKNKINKERGKKLKRKNLKFAFWTWSRPSIQCRLCYFPSLACLYSVLSTFPFASNAGNFFRSVYSHWMCTYVAWVLVFIYSAIQYWANI